MTQPEEQRLLNSREVAEITGISPHTLKRLRRENHPLYGQKALKPGKNLQWRLTDVLDYINQLPYHPTTH